MAQFFTLEILGLKRQLPILASPSGQMIAGFNCVGDIELLVKSAEKLVKMMKDVDYDIVLTTELKGLPIAQEVARVAGKNYVCLRKQAKCYMLNPISTSGESITSGKTTYYISQNELEQLQNKKVLFVDDVFSTGSTFDSMMNFAEKQNFKIVAGATILRECKKSDMSDETKINYKGIDIYICGYLPLM